MDGATGSELDRRGINCNVPLWGANANLTDPDALKAVHRDYLINGAKAVTTNTFSTNKRRLDKSGLGHLDYKLTKTGVEMAVQARDEINPDAVVLGCVAPNDSCYNHHLVNDDYALRNEHRRHMSNLLKAGSDYILIETQKSARESIVAAEVAEELAPGRWAITWSVPTETIGILRCGTPLADIIGKFKKAAFIGINCIDGRDVTAQIKHLRSISPKRMRIAAYGNIGVWYPPKDYQAGVK